MDSVQTDVIRIQVHKTVNTTPEMLIRFCSLKDVHNCVSYDLELLKTVLLYLCVP